ncbi:MAG: CsoS2 family carboxysome shell protein [Sulfuricella sp.]
MSDAMANNTATPRSAREAALERRRALSHNGGAALGVKQSAPARAVNNPAAMEMTAPTAGATGKSLSRARREALSQGGKSGLAQAAVANVRAAALTTPTPVPAYTEMTPPAAAPDVAECEQAIEAVCTIVEEESAAVSGPIASAVRKLCQERRRALSSQGKTAVKSSFAGVSPSRSKGGKAVPANGRDAAKARREALCQQGRGDDPACRPTGRVRPKPAAPAKVETGTTLRGTGLTGTQVERSGKVTGNEPGSCRAITGTEYIGAEQYGELCASVPNPAPAKVSIGNTSRGQRVSGAEIGRSIRVTGDEHGACKSVTGTEYLSADKFESFCSTKLVPAPAKVAEVTTAAGQGVTGTEVGRSAKVTGDEPGSCLKLTGSQYYQPEQFGSLCRSGNGAPHKVSVMSTVKNHPVTGTELAAGALVTGDEHGACTSVTGTEYKDLAQYQACNREPVPTPEKVGVMHTWHDQQVSGTPVERSSKVTGDEHGACQPVSGTEYAGPDQYAAFCEPDQQTASKARREPSCGCMAMTGVQRQSGSKVTGAVRGESRVLSGTPYSDTDRFVRQRGDVAQATHPLTRGPADVPRVAAAVPEVADVRGNFSVTTPARSAQGSHLNRITGTAYGAIGRITGPVNLAAGLVSGTPEFRYRDEAAGAAPVAMGQAQAIEAARSRLTGDGREGGFAITGAAWRRNESVTGTEGTSTRRNPTMRGDQRGVVMGASQNKDRDRPEIPASKITGSSGNDAKGSAITYSGGARG